MSFLLRGDRQLIRGEWQFGMNGKGENRLLNSFVGQIPIIDRD